MEKTDIAYIAGLFDGEGTVGFYRRYETKKDRKGKPRKEHKMQWRWSCSFRNAYVFCCLIHPYCHIKMDKVNKIINHYSQRDSIKFNNRVINFEDYKKAMNLE